LQFAGQGAYGRSVPDTSSTLRAHVHALLHFTDPTDAGRRWRVLHLVVLAIGIFAVITLSIDDLPADTRNVLRYIIWSVAVLFFLEYVVRLWVAPEAVRLAELSPAAARLRWAISLPGLVGLLATMPAVMWLAGYKIVGPDAASIFCALWILKLGLHAPALGTLAHVIENERAPIASVLILFFILLVVAATGARSFSMTRASVPSAGACRPSFRIQRTQKIEAASEPTIL